MSPSRDMEIVPMAIKKIQVYFLKSNLEANIMFNVKEVPWKVILVFLSKTSNVF
jgi:hypothetical protein